MDLSNARTQPEERTNARGVVARLWRYPVKSMRGEPCESPDVHPRGVAGDRPFAIRDTHGRCGSGTRTRRFRQIDGLFGFQAVYDGDVPGATPVGRGWLGKRRCVGEAVRLRVRASRA